MKRRLAASLAIAVLCGAHEGMRNLGPTKAAADLKLARDAMAAAKRKLTAAGRYNCCTRKSCNLCVRVSGSCNCGENVRAGRGACGECFAKWKPGSVSLLTADHQACPRPGETAAADLATAAEAILRAKRILAGEKRFACCIRGGCGQCAHDTYCPCGNDLAVKKKGVCGDCLDRWRAGQGAFDGIDPAEVALASTESPADMRLAGAVPEAAPMDMISRLLGGWTLMAHGQIFGVYSNQSGPRGRDKIFGPNWLMGSVSHRAGPGTFTVHSMLSLDPATITSRRYPLLFATGETAYGVPIVNGQHPHDFLMELAASYKLPLGERGAIRIYGGPRGEPALGPPAYPHRPSASENPVGVIAHHLQDATHIATNVATLGITYGPVTVEASGFHGREPDEQRWGFEGGAIDSFATRLTISPTPRWSGQFSMGRINRGETTHPLRPQLRSTASVMYARPLADGSWTTSLIWGRNHQLPYTQLPGFPVFPSAKPRLEPRHIVAVPTHVPGQIFNSFLAESTLRWRRNWIWGRVESADKDSTILFEEAPIVLLVDEVRLARVQAFTGGYERELPSWRYLRTGIGSQLTFYRTPATLSPIYGTHPVGLQLFLRFRLGSPNR